MRGRHRLRECMVPLQERDRERLSFATVDPATRGEPHAGYISITSCRLESCRLAAIEFF